MSKSPIRRAARNRDPFADETTAQYDPSAVPVAIENEEITVPVDAREMAAAARASRVVPDPLGGSLRPSSEGSGRVRKSPQPPFAEVQVAGTAQVVALAAHNLSPTGLALELPESISLQISTGATVMLDMHLGTDASGEPIRARLPGRVAHIRLGSGGRTGGIAVRWDEDGPRTAATVDSLLSRLGKL